MVTTLNIALEDATADRARAVKEALDLTWAEFIVEATDQLEEEAAEAAIEAGG